MTCHYCTAFAKRFGFDRKRNQRFRCLTCRKTFLEPQAKPLGDMRIPVEEATLILHLLVEGSSVRTVERVTGIGKATILRLLNFAGAKCETLMNERIRNVPMECVEAEEIWAFVGKKEGRRRFSDVGNDKIGDAYTFVGIDAKSKLVACFVLGRRNLPTTIKFIDRTAWCSGRKIPAHDRWLPSVP